MAGWKACPTEGTGYCFLSLESYLGSPLGAELLGGVTPAARMTRWRAATVSGDGRKLRPGRYPSAITRGVRPVLFFRFQTVILAPRSARSCTTLGWFR